MPAPPPAVVLIPVKAFDRAKSRLAASLDPAQRAQLARAMASAVVRAAAPLPVTVVCDDEGVAAWARSMGASVEMTPGVGLNGAVSEAVDRLRARGVRRVVVAHGDLPFARSFDRFVPRSDRHGDPGTVEGGDDVADDEVVIVPDRRRSGTNVLSVPTDVGFRFAYGTGSLDLHVAETARLGLTANVLSFDDLGWDVDEPEDLQVPEHIGRLDASTFPDGPADRGPADDPTTDHRSPR